MPTFVYHGPQARIVELDRDVSDGDTVKGPDALRHAHGFVEVEKAKAEPKAEKAAS